MRVRLKGLNSITKRLADGTQRTYFYAWKGGPPLRGEPGTPEFVASYNEAVARKVVPRRGTLLSVLQGYQASEDFLGLAPRSRSDYIGKIKLIEKEFGDFPLAALTDNRTRGIFKAWRERLAASSRRQADYAWVVLARVLSWGMDRGLVPANPCARGGRLYRGSRAEKIWTDTDEAAFLERAPAHLRLPLLLALWTGQRQGDLLRLPWSAYDGTHIRLRQSKGGARVVIPVGTPLKAAIDAGRLPRLMGQGVQAGGGGRRDVSRSARHRSDATRDCWMHRGRDRDHHWTLAAQRARDHRHALPPPRSNARRERDPQARNANENSRLSARLLRDVLVKKGKHRGKSMAGGLGFEPRLTESESVN